MSTPLSTNLQIGILLKKHGKDSSSMKFAEAKLKTGEVIMYDGETPLQGAAVAIQTPAGDFAPAPDGILELEDGTLIEVSGGLIANVKPAEAVAPEAAAPANPDPNMEQGKEFTPAQDAAVKRIVESVSKETHFSKEEVTELVKPFTELAAKFAETETSFNTKFTAQELTITKQNETITTLTTQLSALVDLMSKAPAEAPAKVAANPFKMAAATDAPAQRDYTKIMEVINSKK